MPTTFNQRAIHETIGDQVYKLKGNLTEQDLDTLANRLLAQLKEKAKAEIHKYASGIKAAMALSSVEAKLRYDVFIAPLPRDAKPRILQAFDWGRTEEEFAVPTSHRVCEIHWDAFAREHGLKLADLQRLSNGEVREIKGWTRDNRSYGDSETYRLGQPYREPAPAEPKEKIVYRINKQPPVLQPPAVYTPSK